MQRFYFLAASLLLSGLSFAQSRFTNEMTTRVPGAPNYSGVAMGVADLNADGLDDVVRLSNSNDPDVLLQQASGNFVRFDLANAIGGSNFWGLCIGDVDNNGANDIAFGGTSGTYLLRGGTVNGAFTWVGISMPPTQFQQGANFIDMDNDGWVDHFACDDVALSVPSRNPADGTAAFVEDYSLINPASTVPSDNSGNYASVWTDYDDDGDLDLYISKCRLFVSDPMDGRRINQMFRNDGANGFTDVAEAINLRPLAQTWATDFADVDNDGDLDALILNHGDPSPLMINDGTGNFTDGSADWGLTGSDNPTMGTSAIQCNFEDFDNDGWIDLLVTYSGGLARIYMNDGNGGYTLETGSQVVATIADQVFQSMASGDLNNDGYVDLYTGYAGGFNSPGSNPDGLLINAGGSNNFLTVRLDGVSSNKSGIGAKVRIYGSWGVQTREIRSGEGYGISNSLTAHFGLGTDTEIDRLVVRWPSGLEEEMLDVAANGRLTITEGTLSATLPLDWQSLSATPVGNKTVRLDWRTSNEEATSHFIVERRAAGGWATVGQTTAQNTAGAHDYALVDEAPRPGDNVYRVRQVDLTGAESISPLATAAIAGGSLSVFPNPASDQIRVTHDGAADAELTLETLDGRVVRRFRSQTLELGTVPAGVYLVRSGQEVRKLVVR